MTRMFVTSQHFLSQERRYNGGETAIGSQTKGEELNPAQAISMLDMDEPARPHVQRKKRQTKGDKGELGHLNVPRSHPRGIPNESLRPHGAKCRGVSG